MPELTSQAMNPQGFTQPEQAKMQTAAQQTAGGANAGAVGQGALLAQRTHNPGTANAAIAQAARNSAQELSKANLGIENQNAMLKEKQRETALGGLENLTGMETGAGINALRVVPEAVNANTEAQNASWDWAKYIMDPMMQAAGGAAGGYLSNPELLKPH